MDGAVAFSGCTKNALVAAYSCFVLSCIVYLKCDFLLCYSMSKYCIHYGKPLNSQGLLSHVFFNMIRYSQGQQSVYILHTTSDHADKT